MISVDATDWLERIQGACHRSVASICRIPDNAMERREDGSRWSEQYLARDDRVKQSIAVYVRVDQPLTTCTDHRADVEVERLRA